MTLAHGTARLESARLVLRRIAPDDLPFFTRIHALPEVAHVRPRRLGPGFHVRDLGHSSAQRPLAARRRTVGRASRRPNGRGRSHVGSLRVAARDRRRGSAPARIRDMTKTRSSWKTAKSATLCYSSCMLRI